MLRSCISRCYRQATLMQVMSRGLPEIDQEQKKTRHFLELQLQQQGNTNKTSSLSRLFLPLPCIPSVTFVTYRNFSTGNVSSRKESPGTDEELESMAKGDKVLKVKLATTRLDGILKAGLQISKNKIEKAFYEDRIRINGARPRKKSQILFEGDEVDIVRNLNRMNKEFLDVSRVEIVTLNEDRVGDNDEYTSDEDESSESKIPAVLKRYKSLTIENYTDPWKGAVDES